MFTDPLDLDISRHGGATYPQKTKEKIHNSAARTPATSAVGIQVIAKCEKVLVNSMNIQRNKKTWNPRRAVLSAVVLM